MITEDNYKEMVKEGSWSLGLPLTAYRKTGKALLAELLSIAEPD